MGVALENPAINRNLYEFTVEKYHELSFSGILPRNLELIFGGIVKKMTITPIHAKIVNKARRIISTHLLQNLSIRQESPITVPSLQSEPEPDLCVVEGNEDTYTFAHPTTALWVIEISNSTLDLDRAKKNIYATAEVPVYWIINLSRKSIEVYSNPLDGDYTVENVFSENEAVPTPNPLNFSICLTDLM